MLWKIGSSLRKVDLAADGDHQDARHEGFRLLGDHLAVRGRRMRRLAARALEPDDGAARPQRAAAGDRPAHRHGGVRQRLRRGGSWRRRRRRRRLGRRGGDRGRGLTARAGPRLVRQRADRFFELGIERVESEQRLPLRRGGGEVAPVPGQLAAGEQIEDEVLPLGRRLHRQVLRRTHRERQRQLLAQPAARLGRRGARGRRGGQSGAGARQNRAQDRSPPHRHQLYTSEEVNTLLATVGAPASSRLSRYSAFKMIASKRSSRRPPVKRSTVIGVKPSNQACRWS